MWTAGLTNMYCMLNCLGWSRGWGMYSFHSNNSISRSIFQVCHIAPDIILIRLLTIISNAVLGGIRFWLTSLRYRVSYQLLSQLALPLTYCKQVLYTELFLQTFWKSLIPMWKAILLVKETRNRKMQKWIVLCQEQNQSMSVRIVEELFHDYSSVPVVEF